MVHCVCSCLELNDDMTLHAAQNVHLASETAGNSSVFGFATGSTWGCAALPRLFSMASQGFWPDFQGLCVCAMRSWKQGQLFRCATGIFNHAEKICSQWITLMLFLLLSPCCFISSSSGKKKHGKRHIERPPTWTSRNENYGVILNSGCGEFRNQLASASVEHLRVALGSEGRQALFVFHFAYKAGQTHNENGYSSVIRAHIR